MSTGMTFIFNVSVQRVERGVQLVNQAGQAMNQAVDAIRNVALGIRQINSAIAQREQMTRKNPVLVEQSASAAESLRHQAHELAFSA